MGTISDKLTYLNATKQKLKDSINALGGDLDNTDTFRSYAEELDNLYNDMPKVTGEGTDVSLNGTRKGKLNIIPKGNTEQDGTPTPDNAQPIRVVTGDNSVVVQNKNLAFTNWANDFITRVNDNNKAVIGTYDNKNCLKFSANVSYGDADNKYIFKTNWKPNTQYTFSFDLKTDDTSGNISLEYTDGTVTNLSNLNTSDWNNVVIISSANKTIKYLRGRFSSGYSYIDLNTFMVEEGSTATEYIEHKEQTYTLHLGTNYLAGIGDYKDEIVGKTDEWKIVRNVGKVNLNLSSTSNENLFISTQTEFRNIYDTQLGIYPYLINKIDDRIVDNGTANTYLNIGEFSFRWGNTKDRVYVKSDKTLTELNALTNRNLYFTLLEPTETPITDTTLINDLNNMYQAMGYDGTTNISITSNPNNAQMIISASSLKQLS